MQKTRSIMHPLVPR